MAASTTATSSAVRQAHQLLRLGRYPEVLQACTSALAHGADDPRLRLLAAHSLLAQGRAGAAAKEAQQVLRLDPGQSEAHRILADICCEKGQLAMASEHLRCVLELEPADSTSRSILDALTQGGTVVPLDNETGPRLALVDRAVSLQRFIRSSIDSGEYEIDGSASISYEISDSMLHEIPSEADLPTEGLDGAQTAEPGLHQDPLHCEGWAPGRPLSTSSPAQGSFDQTLGMDALEGLLSEPSQPTVRASGLGEMGGGGSPEDEDTLGEPTRVERSGAEYVHDDGQRRGGEVEPVTGVLAASGIEEDDVSDEFEVEVASAPDRGDFAAPAPMQPIQPVVPQVVHHAGEQATFDAAQPVNDDPLMQMLSSGGALAGGAPAHGPSDHGRAVFGQSVPDGPEMSIDSWDPLGESHVRPSPDETGDGGGSARPAHAVPASQYPYQASSPRVPWLVIAVVAAVVAAGGVYGFLLYRHHQRMGELWRAVRVGLYDGTVTGARRAKEAAMEAVAAAKDDPKGPAATGLCEAVLAIEFGEDRLEALRKALDKTKGDDSEWRTAASGYLSLLNDPVTAVGYLKKGTEVYADSALLRYLYGRALAAAGQPQRAAAAFEKALKQVSQFVPVRVALAQLIGQTASERSEAVALIDKVIAKHPDNVQALLVRARLLAEDSSSRDRAAEDVRRIIEQLTAKASRGQSGWAELLNARLSRQTNDVVAAMSQSLDAAIASAPCCDAEFRYELAAELMLLYRLPEALTQMEAALKFNAQKPKYLHRAARLLLSMHRPQAARQYIDAAPPTDPRTKLLRGRLALALGHYSVAQAVLGEVARHRKLSVEARVYLAQTKARRGEQQGAVKLLAELERSHRRMELIPKALGQVHIWAGEWDQAEKALKRAWHVNALDPEIPTLLAEVSLAKSDYERATSRYQRALKIQPSYVPAHIGLAELLRRNARIADARAEAERVPTAERDNVAYRALAARLAMGEGDFRQAATRIEAVARSGGGAKLVTRLKGELALARGQASKAAVLLRRAQVGNGQDVELLALRGRALLLARQWDAAFDVLEEAAQRDPDHPEVLLDLGRVALEDGELVQSVKQLNNALGQMRRLNWPRERQAEVYTLLGKVHLTAKDTGRALTNLQDAIDNDPKAALPNYYMGQTYDALDRPRRAAPYYAKAIELNPSLLDAYLRAGRAYLESGEPQKAVQYFEACAGRAPTSVTARAARKELSRLRTQPP